MNPPLLNAWNSWSNTKRIFQSTYLVRNTYKAVWTLYFDPLNGVIHFFNAPKLTNMLLLLDRNWSPRLPISTFDRKRNATLWCRFMPRKNLDPPVTRIIINILIWLLYFGRLLLHRDTAANVASIMVVLIMVSSVIGHLFRTTSSFNI